MICSAQDTLEENYSLQKFARIVMHSNHIDLYASYADRGLVKEFQPFIFSGTGGRAMEITRAPGGGR